MFDRKNIWFKFANGWKLDNFDNLIVNCDLNSLSITIDKIEKGDLQGRAIFNMLH